MKIGITIILFFLSQLCNAQITEIKKWHISKIDRDSVYGKTYIRIDTINGDTAKYFSKSGRYIELNKEGVLIVDGHKHGGMGTACGCSLSPHGYWIERYRNGSLREQGRYFCNKKLGTWIYYYGNGQIKKIENKVRPYIEMFTRQIDIWDTLATNLLLEGPYLEYYANGQLKIEGKYEIVEEFSTKDTIFSFDLETYESIQKEIHGKFWIPRSKKSGYWNFYSVNGELLSNQYFELKTWKDDNIRSIESRYWETIKQISRYYIEDKKEENRTKH